MRAVVGASGAAKWLGICGLDQAIFGQWLPSDARGPIDLLGTSIGSFKLAAACQAEPADALLDLANAYIAQSYLGKPRPETVAVETARVIAATLPDDGKAVLTHPHYRLHTSAALCRGALARKDLNSQKRMLVAGFFRNLIGRQWLSGCATRSVFSDPRSDWLLGASDGIPSLQFPLTDNNIVDAISASGALPVYMEGVCDIADAAPGVYRDGGLLDYHPIPGLIFAPRPAAGITLYPHFFGHLKPGWFDKFLPWRSAPVSALDDILLISPTQAYLDQLPGGKLPDRADFALDNSTRQSRWRNALEHSAALGEEFIACVEDADQLLKRIKPLI